MNMDYETKPRRKSASWGSPCRAYCRLYGRPRLPLELCFWWEGPTSPQKAMFGAYRFVTGVLLIEVDIISFPPRPVSKRGLRKLAELPKISNVDRCSVSY